MEKRILSSFSTRGVGGKSDLLLKKNENSEIVKHCTGISSPFMYLYFDD